MSRYDTIDATQFLLSGHYWRKEVDEPDDSAAELGNLTFHIPTPLTPPLSIHRCDRETSASSE